MSYAPYLVAAYAVFVLFCAGLLPGGAVQLVDELERQRCEQDDHDECDLEEAVQPKR